MTLEIRIFNLEKAMKENKSRSIIKYKFRKYMEEYDNKEKDVGDKIKYRDLSLEYFRYMYFEGRKE